jgi:amino-acid N-acetyltransferase
VGRFSPGWRMTTASETQSFVKWFRSAAPYIHGFRGKTFVIAFAGEVVRSQRFVNLIHDVNLLESLGVKLVLVHGTRPQIAAKLKASEHSTKFVKGLRVTDAEAMIAVKEANGALRVEIEALLSMGLPNSPMAGSDIRVASGNSVTAQPIGVLDGVDLQHTGVVRKIDADQIRRRLDDEEIVLLSPLGYSPTGEVFNLALEDVATSAAVALHADKLIFLIDGPGVIDVDGKLISEVTALRAEALLRGDSKQPRDVRRYLPCAIEACKEGVARCHFIDEGVDGGLLLELFTNEGVGTMLTRDPLESLRPATIKDVGGVLRLIEPLEADGILVKRSRELLEREIENFSVMEHDGRVIGCVALYPFANDRAGELACLAIDPVYRNQGRGERLLDYIEKAAKQKSFRKLFVLSTRSAHWFVERGFGETDVEALPKSKRELYNFQRRSKVFVKSLRRG